MTWTDCLVLGRQLFHMQAYNQTKFWLQESVKRLQQEPDRLELFPSDFLQEPTEYLLRLGDADTALQLYKIIAKHKEDGRGSFKIKEMIQSSEILPNAANDNENIWKTPYHVSGRLCHIHFSIYGKFQMQETAEFDIYQKLCRGEMTKTAREQRDLRCFYVYENNGFSRLAPFKVEDLNLDPEVKIFHNILSDETIEIIKQLAAPHLIRSTVVSREQARAATHNYRISKNTWLAYDSHPSVLRMLRDLHDITGLDTKCSEDMQVANYGLGGHYEPHVDFFPVSKIKKN